MGLWTYLGLGEKPRRIYTYFLHPIGGGRWEPVPTGTVPAPLRRYEAHLRDTHDPDPTQFIVDVLDGLRVAILWTDDRVEAVCFDTLAAAQACPGFEQLSREELRSTFGHFDGWLTGQKAQLRAPAEATDWYDFV